MCGITGSWNFKMDIDNSLKLLNHRGPDSNGYLKKDKVIMTINRLAIVDPKKGKQPMLDNDKELSIVYNGEIYNHMQIRSQLKKYKFKTKSDTETLLYLYKKLGERCLEKLDGMFAFCTYDGKKLFLARDRFGIKPLYYVNKKDFFVFSSEKKILILNGFGEKDIKKLDPGHYILYNGKKIIIKKYYDIKIPGKKITNEKAAARSLKIMLKNSIKNRELADVKIGTLLSGGIDSSIISAVLAKDISSLKSFTVGLKNSEDLHFAKVASDHIGIRNYSKVFSEKDTYQIIPKVVFHLEAWLPLAVRNAIPTYFVSQLAKKHVKVVLCGEGADELFGGYPLFSNSKNLNKDIIEHLKRIDWVNLNRVDKMSMASSIEARVPFLDHNFVELSLSICETLKQNKYEKYILRKAFQHDLPKEIINRPKLGFQSGSGVRNILKDKVIERYKNEENFYKKIYNDIFYSENAWNNKFFNALGKEVAEKLNL